MTAVIRGPDNEEALCWGVAPLATCRCSSGGVTEALLRMGGEHGAVRSVGEGISPPVVSGREECQDDVMEDALECTHHFMSTKRMERTRDPMAWVRFGLSLRMMAARQEAPTRPGGCRPPCGRWCYDFPVRGLSSDNRTVRPSCGIHPWLRLTPGARDAPVPFVCP